MVILKNCGWQWVEISIWFRPKQAGFVMWTGEQQSCCGTVPAVTPRGSVLAVPALSVSRVKGGGVVIGERI